MSEGVQSRDDDDDDDADVEINVSGRPKDSFDHLMVRMAETEDLHELASLYIERMWFQFQFLAHEASSATGKDVQFFMNAFGQAGRKKMQKKREVNPYCSYVRHRLIEENAGEYVSAKHIPSDLSVRPREGGKNVAFRSISCVSRRLREDRSTEENGA